MKIEKLELVNFKQYYGEQTIHFAGFQSKGEQNVTVVYGANGKGKTTIYRALMLALFGVAELAKDKEIGKKGDSYYICNLNVLRESPDGSGMVKVKVSFSHQGEHFELERVLVSQLFDDEQIQEDFLSARMTHIDIQGRTHMYDREEDISSVVNRIFDRRMKDYFLFDGERIEQLMRDEQSQKKEVAKGIKNLLKLDALDDSLQVMAKLHSSYHQEIQNAASGEYRTKLGEQLAKERAMEEFEGNVEKWQEELEVKEREISLIDDQLKEHQDVREQVIRREHLTGQINDLGKRKADQLAKIRDFNKHSFNLLLKDEYTRFYSELEHIRAHMGNPFDIAKELLEKIIEDRKCAVCDSDVDPDSKQFKAVSLLLEKHQEHSYTRELNDLKEEVRTVMEQNKLAEERSGELLKGYSDINKEMKRIQRDIDSINEDIGVSHNADYRNLQQARNNLSDRIQELRLKINQGKDELNRLLNEKREIDSAVKEMEKKEAQKDIKVKMKDIANATKEALKAIQTKFVDEISREVEEVTTSNFRKFIDEDSRQNLKEVKIEKDFSLQVLAWNGANFLPNLSSGQRQILSLSFIISLLSISGGTDKTLEIPLFMDTPFGRISGENRDNLLRLIPDMTPQWILLATDTEFTRVECAELRKTGRWGEVYRLQIPAPGKTEVVRDSVLGFQPDR
ncbi:MULTISPECIES: AAA family ATPase [unclassified Paenibacillus]|uniref:AAA family ATPase n=1 Tax=unclassified Paenibacillus TaxID=185978 RepID=UPI001AEA7F4B|nr:DNA sulfur modification protein DndD [Paenibacillus sp. PvP091]MBP1170596.1 DNA sulfur modification protein DndD [Paenibacillus sp. PvR098]MBP2441624.1 DNA sulfur modification protein DndD [Paenibacillus sp. PvP052]